MDFRHLELTSGGRSAELKEFGLGIEAFPAFVSSGDNVHTHDLIEMVYVCRGEGIHILGDREYPAVPGSLAVIHYNQSHGFKTGAEGLDLINLYLDIGRFPLPMMPSGLRSVLPLILPLHPSFQHNLRDIVHIQFADASAIERLLLGLQKELKNRRLGFHESVQHQFALFLIESCRAYMTQQKIPRLIHGPAAGKIERLCRHIETHFNQSLPLDELARLSGLQKNYLCRAFKAHTGLTVVNYILQQRLGQAMLLLRQTDRPVVDIALDSGFNDLPHFNRTFRREVRMTPREYRRQWH